jgi:hypothetical protein
MINISMICSNIFTHCSFKTNDKWSRQNFLCFQIPFVISFLQKANHAAPRRAATMKRINICFTFLVISHITTVWFVHFVFFCFVWGINIFIRFSSRRFKFDSM